MARNDGRIEPGQKLAGAISAKAWNRAQDAADRVLGVGTGITGTGPQYAASPYTWVYAKNTTGGTVARWGVMAIVGIETNPIDGTPMYEGSLRQFESMPVLTGGAFNHQVGQDAQWELLGWCVAVEPIANNKVGRVAVGGVVQVKVADLPKVARCEIIWRNAYYALIHMRTGMRLGTISATWNKGTVATVTEINGDGSAISGAPTFKAKNHFASVGVASGETRKVACQLIGQTFVLVAAEC